MRKFVDSLEIDDDPISKGTGGSPGAEYCHLLYFNISLGEDTAQTYQQCLETELDKYIFEHPKAYMPKILTKWTELKQQRTS